MRVRHILVQPCHIGLEARQPQSQMKSTLRLSSPIMRQTPPKDMAQKTQSLITPLLLKIFIALTLIIHLHWQTCIASHSVMVSGDVDTDVDDGSNEYDFIVVGGGSTGSVVAGRLASAGHRVLLVEAGGPTQTGSGGEVTATPFTPADNATLFDVPLQWFDTLRSPLRHAWQWTLPADDGESERGEEQPRPAVVRGLGGCSVHNAMVYMRGLDADFDEEESGASTDGDADEDADADEEGEANAQGGKEKNQKKSSDRMSGKPAAHHWPSNWSFKDVLPFYKRSVRQRNSRLSKLSQHFIHDEDDESDTTNDRLGGHELHLSSLHPLDIDPLSKLVLRAWSGDGEHRDKHQHHHHNDSSDPAKGPFTPLPLLDDLNEPSRREGVGLYQFLLRHGRRDTAAQAMYGNGFDGKSGQVHAGKHTIKDSMLTVKTHAHVTRILIDKTAHKSNHHHHNNSHHPRAVGIEYVVVEPDSYTPSSSPPFSHSRPYRIYARYEVILCAGALHTPKLLLLSGIGPRHELKSHDIDVMVDHPGVGRNLMDGAKIIMQFAIKEDADAARHFVDCTLLDSWNVDDQTMEQCEKERLKWLQAQRIVTATYANGSDIASSMLPHQFVSSSSSIADAISYGMYGTPGFAVGAFIRSRRKEHQPLPDVQLTFMPRDITGRRHPDRANNDGNKHDQRRIVTVEVILNQPTSRGNITLRPFHADDKPLPSGKWSPGEERGWRRITHALLPPRVNASYFDTESDVAAMLRAIKVVRKLMSAPLLRDVIDEEVQPGESADEEQLRHYIRCGNVPGPSLAHAHAKSHTPLPCSAQQRVVNHLAGTVRMGSDSNDRFAVLDSSLRVRGVAGLRVADASVMPRLPSGNTHATCQMIGERAADAIIKQYAKEKHAEKRQQHGDKAHQHNDQHPHPVSIISDMTCPDRDRCKFFHSYPWRQDDVGPSSKSAHRHGHDDDDAAVLDPVRGEPTSLPVDKIPASDKAAAKKSHHLPLSWTDILILCLCSAGFCVIPIVYGLLRRSSVASSGSSSSSSSEQEHLLPGDARSTSYS